MCRVTRCRAALTAPVPMLTLSLLLCMLSYADKTIIPSSFQSVSSFLRNEFHTDDVDSPFGALNSVFIVGFALSGMVNGYLARRLANPFLLLAGSAMIFCLAIVMSATAPYYWVLLLARMLSGAGEASLFVLMPPYFLRAFPPAFVGKAIAIFYAGLPLGLAGGGIYASQVSTHFGWRTSFMLELVAVVPAIIWVLLVAWAFQAPREGDAAARSADGNQSGGSAPVGRPDTKGGLRAYLRAFTRLRIYWLIVFGYAGYAAVFAGLAAFGGTFIVALGLVPSQDASALGLGVIVAIGGVIGSILGGYLVDRTRHNPAAAATSQADEDADLLAACEPALDPAPLAHALKVMFCLISLATACIIASVSLARIPEGATPTFFILLAFSIIFLLGQVAATQVAIMASVPPALQPAAMGLSLALMHLLGDVPSPPLIGFLSDALSPPHDCDNSNPPNCTRSAPGMQTAILLVYCWLLWPVLLWGIAWLLVRFRMVPEVAAVGHVQTASATAQGNVRKRTASDTADLTQGLLHDA